MYTLEIALFTALLPIPFIILGYLRKSMSTLISSTIIYLAGLVPIILILEARIPTLELITIIQHTLAAPLGVLIGIVINEYMGRLRAGGFWANAFLLRKVLPVLYIFWLVYSGVDALALILSITLLVIEWYYFPTDNLGLSLTILHTLVLLFMPIPSIPIFSVLITMILDRELVRGVYNPWFIVLTYSVSSALAYTLLGIYRALALIIPLAYILLVALVYTFLYLGARITIRTEVPLRAVQGKGFFYNLIIESKPRIKARIDIRTQGNVLIKSPINSFNGVSSIYAYANFWVGGVVRPTLTIILKDTRGLVKVKREVEHPPVVVIPRLTYLLGLYQRVLSGRTVRGLGDVVEVREYMPGDTLRRVHWAKSIKLDRYVVKVLSKFVSTIAIVPYASSMDVLGKMESMIMTVVTYLLNQGIIPEFLIIDPVSLSITSIRWSNDQVTTIIKVLNTLRNIDVKFRTRSYGSELLSDLRIAYQESLLRALMRTRVETPLILIGEKRFSSDVLKVLQSLFGYDNVRQVLI